MTRQLELADKVSQHPVLTCLSPWMENLTIAAHWKGTWCERLLKSMYYVTLRCVGSNTSLGQVTATQVARNHKHTFMCQHVQMLLNVPTNDDCSVVAVGWECCRW